MTEFRTLLSNFVKKSQINGLLKNDGTVDRTSYATLDQVYPVGSIYMSINSTDPSTLFGGSWTRLKDTFLLACGDTYSSDGDVSTSQHGSASVTLTSAQSGLKAHGHGMGHTHSHSHTPTTSGNKFLVSKDNISINGTKRAWTASGSNAYFIYVPDKPNGINEDATTSTNAQASSKSTTDNNTTSNASEAHENMPPYMAVYMWKRTS